MKASVKEGESARDHLTEALARIGNPLNTKIDGWFDIATAPKDGTLVLVRDGKWEPCHGRFVTEGDGGYWKMTEYTSFTPTLWQPMPKQAE